MPNYNSRKERKRAEEEILNKIQTLETDNQQEINKSVPVEKEDKMIQGTFWMTFGSIFSRLLGA